MNPLPYIPKFLAWITGRRNREAAALRAELSLSESQHRAEVFALEQSLCTMEAERDCLKAQILEIEKSHGFTKEFLDDARQEIDNLHKKLEDKEVVLDRFRCSNDTQKKEIDSQKSEIDRLDKLLKERP